MSTALSTLTNKLASKFGMADSEDVMNVLKATAFKGPVSDAQMTALMVVANQYGLNPWTREIYAFPDQNNGIVPVVGVDGWARIINEHPQFDGIGFEADDEKCSCIIYRKDRQHATQVTEYLQECRRETKPWKSHPRRMLRHKSMIQCARLAFGYTGIYEQDEAERIIEGQVIDGEFVKQDDEPPKSKLPYPEDQFQKNFIAWTKLIQAGKKTADDIIKTAASSPKYILTSEQTAAIQAVKKPQDFPTVTYAQVAEQLNKAKDIDLLDAAADLIGEIADEQQRKELGEIYNQRRLELEGAQS